MIRQALGSNRVAGNATRVDRFVQADRRLQGSLQLGMIAHVVVVERLLDHHQGVCVELREMVGVVESVCRIGIDHQRNIAEAGADHVDRCEIPARLDLDLDALIAGGELALNLGGELIERILNADRNAGCDARAGAAEDS